MRVLHVITRLIVGGAQENTTASVLGLRNKPGLTVELISGSSSGPEGSLESEFDAAPGTLTFLPELVRPIRPWIDWKALIRLTETFRERKPDIVHTHSGKAGIVGRLAAARAKVPVIIHTVHGPSFGNFQGWLSNLVFRTAEQRAGKVTTHFVVVADAMSRQYLAAGIGRPTQYTRILSGFNLEPFLGAKNDPDVRKRWGISPADLVVGKIARLTELKGHDDLLAVAADLRLNCPRMKFLLVGGGPWSDRLEKKVRALGLTEHFVFTGLVRPHEVAPLIGIMDIVAHLSSREGLPRALPQALAAGKPVVAYDCDGAAEVCREGETGFAIRPGDLAGLKTRLIQLAQDPGLRAEFGDRGRDFVKSRFSVERMVDDLHALYLKLTRRERA